MLDCQCCDVITKQDRDPARSAGIRRAVAEHVTDIDALPVVAETVDEHTYHLGRCIRCGRDWLTGDLPGYESCERKAAGEQIVYSTETGKVARASHSGLIT